MREVVVIGAGAAGLGVAAELGRRGVGDVLVLERTGSVGASWRARYEGLRLNTERRLSSVPRHPIPRSAGSWPSREAFVAYLEEVAARAGAEVRLNASVERVDREGAHWRVQTASGALQARFVVVATGYDHAPKLPDWPGQDDFRGELLHASAFRNATPFRGRHVLVVGAGNSGTEIATQLAGAGAARVQVSVRTPVNIMPSTFLGLPTPLLARLSEDSPRWVVDRVGFAMQRLAWGDLTAYGLSRAPHGIATELRVRGLGATLDRGFVAALKEGRLAIVPAVVSLAGADVVLAGGELVRPDAVIAATGYRHALEPLVGHLGVLLPSGRPAQRTGKAHPAAPRLYFNGFWLPLSGQLPAMRRTSRRIAREIARELRRTPRTAKRPRKRGLSRSSSAAAA